MSKYIKMISPKLTNAFIGLGMMETIKNNSQSALGYFEKAVVLEPTNVQACGLKLRMLIQLNDKSTARAFIEALPENMQIELKKANYSVGL